MNTYPCDCFSCIGSKVPIYAQPDAALFHVVNDKKDAGHAHLRVYCYIELYYRCGECDDAMPYRVWQAVMGDAPPPTSNIVYGSGAFPIMQDDTRYFLPTPRPAH